MSNDEYEDKTSQNEYVEDDELETNEADNGEDNGSTESDDEEDERITLSKSELEKREREIRKEQDRRWRERIKKASGEDDSKEIRKEDRNPSQDERYDRLELKTEGVKDKSQQDFVLDYARLKNISVTEALNAPVVRAELREMSEEVKQRKAIPSSSNRTAQPKKDVEYWAHQLTEKGKSAPTADMRRQVRKYLAGE